MITNASALAAAGENGNTVEDTTGVEARRDSFVDDVSATYVTDYTNATAAVQSIADTFNASSLTEATRADYSVTQSTLGGEITVDGERFASYIDYVNDNPIVEEVVDEGNSETPASEQEESTDPAPASSGDDSDTATVPASTQTVQGQEVTLAAGIQIVSFDDDFVHVGVGGVVGAPAERGTIQNIGGTFFQVTLPDGIQNGHATLQQALFAFENYANS